jgi:hypothetical protein
MVSEDAIGEIYQFEGRDTSTQHCQSPYPKELTQAAPQKLFGEAGEHIKRRLFENK